MVRWPGEAAVAGREGDEDLARAGRRDAAHPGDPQAGSLGEALALVREERRVGGEDDDDRARAGLMSTAAAASPRAGQVVRGVPGARDFGRGDCEADRDAVDPQELASPVVRLYERADGEAAGFGRDDAGRGADAALELVADHAGPTPDPTLGDRAAGRSVDRGVEMVGQHVETVDVIEQAVVRLADHGQGPEVGVRPVRPHGVGEEGVVDDADGMGVRDRDRARRAARTRGPTRARSARRCR